MKNKVIIFIMIIVVILIAVGIYFGIKMNNISKYEKADIYTVNGEEITSVKKALGEKKIKKYSYKKEETETLELYFKDEKKAEPASKYIQTLLDNENYIKMRTDSENKIQIAKSAEKSPGIITVEAETTNDGFKITIIVGPGKIQLDPME